MQARRILSGIAVVVGLLPTLAHADLTLIGRSFTHGQGFGSVINVLTLQQNGSEAGSVAWDGTKNVITGTTTSGCPATAICDNTDTGASNNFGKTSTQTFGDIGWIDAASIVVSLNMNQTGSAPTITLENLVMNVYSPTGGAPIFTAPLDPLQSPHVFTTIEQGTGTGYFIFELNAAEQSAATTALFGVNYNANNRVGLFASLDKTSNAGAETFGVVNANLPNVPEPGFYGALALGLCGLCFAVQKSRRKKTL